MQKHTRRRIRLLVPLLGALAFALPTTTVAAATGPGGWDHLGNGGALAVLTGTPAVLYPVGSTQLIVGGVFANVGGHPNADNLASWNGSAWNAFPGATPLNGGVRAIAFDGSHLVVGGVFTDAGGNADADFLARLGDSGWEPFCNGAGGIHAAVNALQVIGSTLYIGGAFQNGAGLAAGDYLLACDLTTGTPSSTVASELDGFSGGVHTLGADTNGNLYAGGGYSNLAQIPQADDVAYLDTTASGSPGSWHAMGSGPGAGGGAINGGFVRSLTVRGTDVYVSADALDIAGIADADHVAKWDGTSWSALGANTAGTNGWFSTSTFIYGMTTFGPLVFVTGSFQNANGDPRADQIAYFDGAAWHPVGSDGNGNGPWIGDGLTLAMFGGDLFAGGGFTAAGGDSRAKFLASFSPVRPDARIGLHSGGPFTGSNVYSALGTGERRTISVQRGHAGTLFFDVQNDGLTDRAFKLDGNGSARGFTIKYFRGTANVTSAVRAGTYTTRTLSPGQHVTLKMVVRLGANTARAATFVTKAKSGPGRPVDAAKARVRAL
ncbi:MAG: hypothetical protein QOJ03_539 [Frankiaceae bacterium]|nr:hypothetical protein [Frankiaceae bacterium]